MTGAGRRESNGTVRPRTATARAVAALLGAIVLLLLAATALPGSALAATDYQTILGGDGYQNSVLVSQAGFAPGVEAVVVCDADSHHSATCSAPLAALHGGPVLLTPGDSLDARVNAEVGRLNPGKIFAVGLRPVVVDAIKAAYPELDASGSIITLLGADACETARLVAERIELKAGVVTGVVLVPSDPTIPCLGYSVSVAPLAAAKGWPILLTPVSGPLPGASAQAINDLGATFVLRIANDYDLGIAGLTTKVLWGSNGYHTAALVAEYAVSEGLDRSHVAVVTGYDGWSPWGLAIAPYLALDKGVALIVAADQVPAETASLLVGWSREVKKVDFSGPSPYTCEAVKLLLTPPGGSTAVALFQETDLGLSYSGAWYNATQCSAFGGTYCYANSSGAALTVEFSGTELGLMSKKSPAYGVAQVTLDGGTPVYVDLYNPSTAYKQNVYGTGPLENKEHTLVVEWGGAKNAASLGYVITVDAIYIEGTLLQTAAAPDVPGGLTFARVATGARSTDVFWLEQKLTELSYRPGPVDGVFDQKTYQGVIAFQKWEGLGRDGVVDGNDWERLLSASRPMPAHILLGTWIEVNRAKQVLLYCRNGVVVRTLPASTGSSRVGIVTPAGTYSITTGRTPGRGLGTSRCT